jgi:hypothetical protein
MRALFAVIALLLGSAPVLAQVPNAPIEAPPPQAGPPPPDNAPPSGRFSFRPVEDGFLRLDSETGQVAFCSARVGGWTCETAADDRAALETKIDRLQDEVEGLKRQLARLREPPPRPPADVPPSANQTAPEKRDDTAQLRRDLERARIAFENAWQRLVDMLINFQQDMMRKS